MSSNSIYSFSAKTTSITYPWPPEVTGIERIALSAKGDLQRLLSAFFDRPISIATVYSHTYSHISSDLPPVPLSLPPDAAAIAAVSPNMPILQKRQVHLQCSGKVVCVATSQVRITSPECARLFLVEKYAIGQMFARMEKVPSFELMSVGLGPVVDDFPSEKMSPEGGMQSDERYQLWRKYKLHVSDFECEILEVFPTRDMFVGGTSWLDSKLLDKATSLPSTDVVDNPATVPKFRTGLVLSLGLAAASLAIALGVSL